MCKIPTKYLQALQIIHETRIRNQESKSRNSNIISMVQLASVIYLAIFIMTAMADDTQPRENEVAYLESDSIQATLTKMPHFVLFIDSSAFW